jgi:DNA recombination protein RmuC
VRAYNDTVGSLESRVLVTARRFSELSVTRGTLEEVEQVDRRARVPGAPELTGEGRPGITEEEDVDVELEVDHGESADTPEERAAGTAGVHRLTG